MESSSPWARQGSPAATLPGPRAQSIPPTPAQALPPPQAAPQWPAPGQPVPPPEPPRRPVSFGKISLALLSAAVAAAVSSGTTLLWVAHERQSAPPDSVTTPQSSTPAQQFSPEQINDAKTHLCQTFNVSVRGQQGQGGYRVEGKVNVPMTLRTVNSALTVQVALVPAVPADVANAARTYVKATLDTTTAAMGNTPTSELNRLTDVDSEAITALLDVCGLPR
jgi:hypothetical protein